MPGEYKEEKTEQPTARKRNKAITKGNVAQSMEVYDATKIMTMVVLFLMAGSWMFYQFQLSFKWFFMHINEKNYFNNTMFPLSYLTLIHFLKPIFPILIVSFLITLISGWSQFGMLWNFDLIFQFKWSSAKPKFSALNPFTGKKFMDLGISIIKLIIIAPIVYVTIYSEADHFIPLLDKDLNAIFSFGSALVIKIFYRVAWLLILIAFVDFIYQKWKNNEDLKMTKEEVKDEQKNIEGDPKIKSMIRRKQFQMAISRMMQEIPKASVVITNPTHYAVALKYDSENMGAPKVVAKGMRKVALKIRSIAESHGIPIMENPPLARGLYKNVQIGHEIPSTFFKQVAEVLAFIYKLGKMKLSNDIIQKTQMRRT